MNLPLIIEPEELEPLLDSDDVLIADLCKDTQYVQAHIPGAYYVNYADIVSQQKPVMGLLPPAETFSRLLSSLGITPDTHVVAYDDEGGGRAARLIWTLFEFGHEKASLLNGGIFSWANEGHPLTPQVPPLPAPSDYALQPTQRYSITADELLQKLGDAGVGVLDARSLAEYTGVKRFAERGGHIPGAIHYEWTSAIDPSQNARMRPLEEIRQNLEPLGITPDKEIVVYCQTHHRSAFSWVMLRALGYENVRGYQGSWSEWGNRTDLPVE